MVYDLLRFLRDGDDFVVDMLVNYPLPLLRREHRSIPGNDRYRREFSPLLVCSGMDGIGNYELDGTSGIFSPPGVNLSH